jgi:drug/metabolite transporter (DMT)-like permease
VLGLFAAICLIWGGTWLAMKMGIQSVPPVFFAGTRFLAAGAILLLISWLRHETRRLEPRELARLLVICLLMVVLTYAPLFWAMRYVPSGLSAVLDLTLMPLSLLGFGLMLGEERWSLWRGAALGVGFGGLIVLFGPEIAAPKDVLGLIAAGAIVFSAVVYSLGSVVARPLAASTGATFISAITLLPGGVALTFGALAFEPGAVQAARFFWSPPVWAAWGFLVIFGSLLAFTGYLRLIAAWGPAAAGSYAYISPVVAVILGVLVAGEHVGVREACGMALLLVAAFFSMRAASPKPREATRGAWSGAALGCSNPGR